MADRDPPPDVKDVGDRLKALQAEVSKDTAAGKAAEQKQHGDARATGAGLRIGIELVVAVLGGAGIGLLIDSQINTQPIFTLAFTALGFAAGVLTVLRFMKGLDTAVGYGRAVRDKEARDAAEKNKGQAAWDDDE